MTVVILVALVCAGFCAFIADAKYRSPLVWGLIGFLFGPLGLLAIGFTPAAEG